jgi:hypothetical protein
MDVDALHILIATAIVLAWLVILFGWLSTCGLGEKPGNPRNVRRPIETPPSKDKSAA